MLPPTCTIDGDFAAGVPARDRKGGGPRSFDAVDCIAARLQMRSKAMKEKKDIVENWLPRYTGTPLAEFGAYVLLTNFDNYAEWFATLHSAAVKGADRPMPNVTSDGITLINFGMGSPNAATVMDLLSAIAPKAVLFLGKCGGLKRRKSDWRLDSADCGHSR